jgi:hydroxymethylpyrimidine/phosphomethylpyrimidine kinase
VIPVALTIAGSDSSGGAGIQADLKTFSALKVYGMTVITALTAQNTTSVMGVREVEADFVGQQIDATVSDIVPGATKTGMLLTAGTVEIVASKVHEHALNNLVVDPVTTSSSGRTLLNRDAVDKLRRQLLPAALIVTPNIDEARLLSGVDIRTPEDMEEAALRIHSFGPKYVYMKGGHLEGDAIDVLFDGEHFEHLQHERVQGRNSHGTGCVLSAAMTAYLARGEAVPSAARHAKAFVTAAIRNGLPVGAGCGPCDPLGLV